MSVAIFLGSSISIMVQMTLTFFLLLIWFGYFEAVTPPSEMLGNMPNYNPFTGEMEDLDFRVAIRPHRKDCYHQQAKHNHTLEINYQVIETSSRFQWMYSPNSASDLVIDFSLIDPTGALSVDEHDRPEGSHLVSVPNDGVYSLCFNNRFSSTKLINLEVYLYSEDDDDRWGFIQNTLTFPPDIQYLDTVESIKVSINKVRDSLNRVSRSQDEKRAIEARDSILADKNLAFINRFSLISTILIVGIGICQIFIIRSLFEEKSYLKKIFRFI